MDKYIATGWLKHTEEDIFNEGCVGKGTCYGGHETFTGATIDAIIKQCASFAGQDDMSNVLLDSCEEASRLDVQVYENADGTKATESELARWREGKERIWLSTYTFNILECRKVVLQRHVADKKIYAKS